MNFELNLRQIAEKWNVDFLGIADLAEHAAIKPGTGLDRLEYPKAISIGITLFSQIVDQLPNRKERSVSVAYKHHCYDVINNRLDLVASEMSSLLQRNGFGVLPIPALKIINDKMLQ